MRIRTLFTAAPAVLLAATTVAGSGAAAAASPGMHAAAATACTNWQVVTTPPVPGATTPPSFNHDQVSLESVSALAPGDAWFTGRAGQASPPTWALHWDGHGLTQPPQPDLVPGAGPGSSGFPLPGSFDSDTDGWQVIGHGGDYLPVFDDQTTFAEHWHNGQWTLTPMAGSPDPGAKGIALPAVAALSPSNAWAAGTFDAIGAGNVYGVTPVGAVLEHWDGTQWSIVPNPAQDQAGATLYSLAVVSPTNIWAAGFQGYTTGQIPHPLIEHWDGKTWSVVPAPPGQGPSGLYAISADGPADAWAVGSQDGFYFGTPLVEHWDGTTWATVSLPTAVSSAFDPALTHFDAVYAASPSDIWAGAAVAGDPHHTNVLLHWDGTAWATVPIGPQEYGLAYGSEGDGAPGGIWALGGTGPGDVWAAGMTLIGNGFLPAPLAAHLSCG